MDKRVSIRLYESGDARGISEMFTKYTPYLRDDAYWVWINRIVGQSISVIAELNGEIIGHYAVVPRNIIIKNQIFRTALGIQAFVDPEYRNEVSIFEISSYLYNVAKSKGIQIIYGFPNINYRKIQIKIERWKEISLFKSYELDSSKVRENTKSTMQLHELKELDYQHLFNLSEMITCLKTMDEVSLNVDTNYWINRYVLNPQKTYQIYALSKHNVPVGYMVAKRYENSGIHYSHIIDYILLDNLYMDDMIASFLNYEKAKCDYFSFWKGDSQFKQSIEKHGFIEAGFETCFCVKILDKSLSNLDCLLNFDNWRLVMGDSDAF